jgi:hypothetical protein
MKNRFTRWLFWCAVLALCAACGGGGGKSQSNAQIRLVNSTHSSALSLTATSTASSTATATTVNSAVAEGAAGSYGTLAAGNYTVNVGTSDGSLTASTQTLSLAGNANYTLVAYQRGGVINTLLLTDNVTTPASGFATFTVYNYSPDAGAVDIYVTVPNADISNLSPTITNLSANSASIAQSLSQGTYDIVVTATNRPTDVRLTLHSVSLTSTEIAALALTTTVSGALVDGTIIQQGGAVQLQRVTEARVRLVAAFPAAASASVVTAAAGGVAVQAVTSPSVGTYTLVPAGSTLGGIEVDGASLPLAAPLSTTTFVSGGDYTLLVYDTGGPGTITYSATVFADSNLLPSTGAKIRLINAGVPQTGGVTLIDNFVPIVTNLAYGQASAYSGVASGTSTIQVTSPPVPSFNGYQNASFPLTGGGVYTFFVLGKFDNTNVTTQGPTQPLTFPSKDR